MFRPTLSLRRPFSVAAAGLTGLVTVFAVAAPATATNPSPVPPSAPATAEPTPTAATPPPATCVDADEARYTHTFDGPKGEASITLVNGPLCQGEEQELALVSYLAPSAKFAVPQYLFDKSVKKFTGVAEGEIGAVTKLEFKVEVPACFTQVDFVFGSEIIDPITEKGDRYGDRKVGSDKGIGSRSKGKAAWYNGGAGSCVEAPAVEHRSDCDGGFDLVLVNRGNVPTTFAVRGSGGYTEDVTVAAGASATKELTAEQGKEVTVEARGMETFTGGWTKPEDCQEPEVGEPETAFDSTCEELILEVVNPANGINLTSTFTPSVGTPKTVTFEPGTTKEVTFPAAEGLSVVVTGDLASEEPITWTAPKGGCADGGTGGGEGDEGGLPVTGAAAGGIAAGAAALLALGAVLFVVARRRRIRFTA
ncbi:cell wall anchor protein [Micromonospora cathayae]|uniref:Cell wall anchor protein n=1 Tax=Micromonospora cathayae TaxID=3028804 RepID=A0ABY7ZWH1_9ACTN|nr:cell wall anchor protein [Micromonospora sp. HUAS 3]WDZ87412.1 cell wall anchor protein [Micromonospora sp. HUAS 3]